MSRVKLPLQLSNRSVHSPSTLSKKNVISIATQNWYFVKKNTKTKEPGVTFNLGCKPLLEAMTEEYIIVDEK